MAWLAGYAKRAAISIPSSGDGELTNFQFMFSIVKGSGSNSGSTIYFNSVAKNWPYDIRFTSSDGVTLIDFWSEESDGTDGSWWVEVPSVPASGGTVIYCYYGKSDATDASDGSATFPNFTDFPGSALPDGWAEYKASGNPVSYAVADSVLTITLPVSSAAVGHAIICSTGVDTPSIIRVKHKINLNGPATGGTASAGQIGFGSSTGYNHDEANRFSFRNAWRGDSTNDWINMLLSVGNNTVCNNTWITKEYQAKSGDNELWHDGISFMTCSDAVTLDPGYLKIWSIHSSIQTGSAYQYVDWILTRSYTDNPPAPSAGIQTSRPTAAAIIV